MREHIEYSNQIGYALKCSTIDSEALFLVKQLRILHLEDDEDDADLVCAILQDAGIFCDFVRVQTRPDFEREIAGGAFDLVLADYSLPTFNGLQALEVAQRLQPELPFIFLSGALGEERAIETLKGGATDYILKQRLEKLPTAIERALRERDERVQREQAQRSLAFLSEAGAALTASLDYETTLETMANYAVPFLADSCVIDIFDGDEVPQVAAIAHIVPEIGAMIRQFRQENEIERIFPEEMLCALQRGESILTPVIPPEWMQQFENDPEHLSRVQQLHIQSAMSLPLQARGRTLGFISLSTLQSGFGSARVYNEDDLSLAKSLTHRAALAIDNARLYRETQDALRARDEFLATLSHELRTPLNAMLGWTQLLRAGNLDEDMAAQALEIIERNTKAQAQLIEDLLEVSRIITGKLRLDVQAVSLDKVISDALESVHLATEARDLKFEYSNLCDCAVAGDAHRLQQVVWNLLSNAIKFTPKGGAVSVVLDRIESHARITVSDSGQGIAPEFLPHVFERFRQADSSSTRSYGGLGLGLGIVRQLVELHGGTVKAESDGLERGATFTVQLPLLAVHPANDTDASQEREVISENAVLREMELQDIRVLVVDDHADARRLVSAVLEGRGARVQSVSTARDAMEKLQSSVFDVLVSDIGMPDEDGYSLMRRIRQTAGENGQIPALALTAYARDSERELALQCGFQAHAVKPIEPSKLIELVAQLAGKIVTKP